MPTQSATIGMLQRRITTIDRMIEHLTAERDATLQAIKLMVQKLEK